MGDSAQVRRIASERMEILLNLSKNALKEGEEVLAKRYVSLARKIGERHSVRLKEKRRGFCGKCLLPLIPGKSSRVRVLRGGRRLLVKCLRCGHEKLRIIGQKTSRQNLNK